VSHFLRTAGGVGPAHIPAELMRELMVRPWRGNVRELRNFVERARALGATEALAMTSSSQQVVSPSDVPSAPPLPSGVPQPGSLSPPSTPLNPTDARMFEQAYKDFRENWIDAGEKEYVRRLLLRHDRNVAAAAREAEVDRTYIYRLIRKHEL
jgi:two-component system, NtrC family, response regulator GlrR